jgi:cyclic-di-GMP phosphodiesterase TipF (flagellum assembly factor)
MRRLAVAGLGIALLCAAAYFMPWSLVAPRLPEVDLMSLLLSAIALLISIVAAAAALRTARHTARLRSDLVMLARSVDAALSDVAARTDRETATVGEMTSSVAREIDRLSERVAQREDGAAQAADNVIPHPSTRRTRPGGSVAEQAHGAPDAAAVEAAYRKAVTAAEFDIALQPIVSVAHSVAAGFEVFASLPLDSGQRIDLRRPAGPAARADAATFERILLTTALQAGRKRLGTASVSMPLHIAVSEAILSDSKGLGVVLDMLQFYPELARSFVLSMPAALFSPGGDHRQALMMLAEKGVGFASEGWDEAVAGEPIGPGGLAFVKVSANRLLDRERARRKLGPASLIVERAAAANVAIIATGVASDEDAVSLIDLGIDLMSGVRFGGPKRLKPEGGGSRPGRLALI